MDEVASRSDLLLAIRVRHWRHPDKDGLITMAGDEDCDIPELTADFLFGGAQIEQPDVPDSDLGRSG